MAPSPVTISHALYVRLLTYLETITDKTEQDLKEQVLSYGEIGGICLIVLSREDVVNHVVLTKSLIRIGNGQEELTEAEIQDISRKANAEEEFSHCAQGEPDITAAETEGERAETEDSRQEARSKA